MAKIAIFKEILGHLEKKHGIGGSLDSALKPVIYLLKINILLNEKYNKINTGFRAESSRLVVTVIHNVCLSVCVCVENISNASPTPTLFRGGAISLKLSTRDTKCYIFLESLGSDLQPPAFRTTSGPPTAPQMGGPSYRLAL